MFNGDRLSRWMGAPPHTWKESERVQIKNIHRCYQQAYSGKHDVRVELESVPEDNENENTFTTKNGTKVRVQGEERRTEGDELISDKELDQKMAAAGRANDVEKFLPANSPLRSEGGDRKKPINVPFKDYDAFQRTCHFDYWRPYFDKAKNDKFLTETARGIVAKICTAQSRNELRSFNGHVPFRKKREHITPLALVFHEIKDWCVTYLRTADYQHEDTFKEIKNRIEYLAQLGNKEVWGNSVLTFGQGIRSGGQGKIFRFMTGAIDELDRAEKYCYRGYCRRSSREKLKHIGNALKDLVLNEMRVFSGRFQLEYKLEDPKTARLQPMDLLNSIDNLHFVDFKNPVNVLLYKILQDDLVKACITGDFESNEVKQAIKYLDNWSDHNIFVQKGASEPVFLFENKRNPMMPAAYTPAANELKIKLRKHDPRTPVPDPSKRVVARVKAAFEKDEAVADIIKKLMACLAALQDLMPSLYAIHKLWTLAGEGGDFTIYDSLREHVIRVMDTIMEKTQVLRKASKNLKKAVHKRAELKEKEIQKINRKRGKMVYKPNWLLNHNWIGTELAPTSRKSYGSVMKKLYEVAKDAKDYTLTADQLSDKIVEAKAIFDAFAGVETSAPVVEDIEETEAMPVPINTKKRDKDNYIANRAPVMDDSDDEDMFGANNNFGDQSSASPSRRNNNYPAYDSDSD